MVTVVLQDCFVYIAQNTTQLIQRSEGMKKLRGKTSIRRNYLSLMYVPHHQGGVKTIRINHYRTTLLSTLAILLVALLMLTGYTLSVVKQNQALKAQHTKELNDILLEKQKLETLIATQAKELAENAEIITTMESSKTISQEAIDEYKSQYEEMVLAYVDNNLSEIPTISRGDRKPASFKEDVAELRALIDVVETAKLSEENVSAAISDKADELNEYLDALPTLWPTRGTTIDSPFGRRLHPIYKKYLTHEGIDIGYNKDPVYAAGTGKVILAGWNGGYGNCIVINHGNGYKTVYGHLRQIKVKEGQWVTKGEEIGIIGNTGNSTGPHLHFEVRVNDVAIDPTYFVDP